MDKIKGLFNDLTGGDGKLDGDDLKNVDVNDLQAKADQAGLGDLTGKLDQLGIDSKDIETLSKLDFPVDKTEVISALKTAGVSGSLIGLVEKAPDQVFESINDLRDKLPI